MRFIYTFITLFLFSTTLFAKNDSKTFNTIGKDLDSIIVKDLSKNRMLYKKNENKVLRPASLTKIMTCMLAIESGKMNKVVTITKPMIQVEPTKLDLKVGDQVKLKDLVHAALIKSANDAALSIAYYLGNNDKERFIKMMNKKAKRIGMRNTNFVNPSGFDDNKHKSTAKDLMKLAEYAIKNKTFNSIVKLNKYTFKTLNSNKIFSVYTSNKLQRENKYVVGLKTGYTSGAGACLIARAKKDRKDILLVMLNADNRWNNAKKALNEAMKSEKQAKKTIKMASNKHNQKRNISKNQRG
jgi:D-alanyl-D-alanine carboxypeptidase (penicillin-binding protein 5/6)